MKSRTSVLPKVVRNGEPEKEGHPYDEEVPHRVHVRELQEREPHRSCKANARLIMSHHLSELVKHMIIECVAHQQDRT